MEQNNKRKFDICLMNPPYGEGANTIHLKFVDKILDIAHKQITVMPFRLVERNDSKKYQKFYTKFDKYLISVEQEENSHFKDVDFRQKGNVGIYYFSDEKNEDNINIKYLDREEKSVKSLFDISNYTSYEKDIIEYLNKNGKQMILCGVSSLNWKKIIKSDNKEIINKEYKELLNKNSGYNKLKKVLDENPGCCGIIVSSIELVGKAKCFTIKNGQIYDNYEDFENFFIKNKSSKGYNVLMFKSMKAAENAKIALQNPVLRFTFLREQKDRMMGKSVYQYVPHIDWEDERCKTDTGLLELCGCPKDKAIEYSNYCKEIINKVDNK